jgi:MarR family 2-MHQ and catechol resistance regulon transcriptional repressor
MMLIEKSLNNIFELHATMDHKIFKDFIKAYPMPDKLNHRHMRAIINLYFVEKASMTEISQRLSIEKGSFTPVADKLIKLGYIINERSQKDRRVYEMSLTPKGKELAKDFVETHNDYITDLFSKLSQEELKAFSDALELVTVTLKKISNDSTTHFTPLR